jgi:hypothetical protein
MWMTRPAWSMEAAKRMIDGDPPGWVNFTVTRGPDGAVTCCIQPSLGVALAIRNSLGESRSTSTLPASPAPWFCGGSPTWGAGPWSVWGGAQLLDDPGAPPPWRGGGADPDDPDPDGAEPDDPGPDVGGGVGLPFPSVLLPVVALESVPAVFAVVELAPSPALAPLGEDVVVALPGPDPAFAGDGSAANTGEIATRPTTPAASGNRNRRCMAASSIFCNFR